MVVGLDGDAITQRQKHELALVRAEVFAGAKKTVIVTVPGFDAFSFDDARPALGAIRTVRIFDHTGPAIDEGDAVAHALSTFLGVACRLVRIPADHRRPLAAKYFSGDAHAAFADGFPLLLASEASLEELNRRLEEPIAMSRFRPNLVVRGGEPFAEDGWKTIRIGGVELELVKPCDRCVITTVDQETGAARGPEPLRTLATFRRSTRGVSFGHNAVALSRGTLAVGDRVDVVSRH